MNRVHKPTGNGTTHKIREQLNFKDNKKWKQFSSRRLELIDKFGLSERKASEQDDNIRQIATILRTEFGYPAISSGEFEKLVTAAVQSVRRNRKRCTKTRNGVTIKRGGLSSGNGGSSGGGTSASDAEDGISQLSSPVHSRSAPPTTSSQSFSVAHSQHGSMLPPSQEHHQQQQKCMLPVLQPKPVRVVATRSIKLEQLTSGNSTAAGSSCSSDTSPVSKLINYNEILMAIIAELVDNRVPISEQARDEKSTGLADLAMFSQHSNLLSLVLASSKEKGGLPQDEEHQKQMGPHSDEAIPFFLRETLLLSIQRSKTCVELSTNKQQFEQSMNLCMLGDMCIRAALAFIMERFFSNLMSNSVEYIVNKLTSMSQLASISFRLFSPGIRSNMKVLPMDSQLVLFQLLIGAIVKDFGFDPCIYPLGEVFHDIILKQYPLACQSSATASRSIVPLSSNNKTSTILTAVSMKPQLANKDINRKVILRYTDKEQRFTFPLLSNGPPTISEIIENSKSLFQIPSAAKTLSLYHNGALIKDDIELGIILNKFTSDETVIELKQLASPGPSTNFQGVPGTPAASASLPPVVKATEEMSNAFNGLTILSTVSTNASITSGLSNYSSANVNPPASSTSASNYTHTNSSSIAALDSIISRISSPIAVKSQSVNGEITAPPIIRPRSPQQASITSGPFDKGLPQPVFQPLL